MAELNTYVPGSGSEVFGEMAQEFADWVSTDDIAGAKIVVSGYRLTKSQMNTDDEGKPADKAIIDISYYESEDDSHYGYSTESKTILRQLKTQNFPFLTALEKVPLKSNPKWKTLSFTEV